MTQESYSRLWGSPSYPASQYNRPFRTDAAAKAARDERYRELKVRGVRSRRSVLRGQLRPYWSMGVPCNMVCDCYYLDIEE